jgi:hypothetical protein
VATTTPCGYLHSRSVLTLYDAGLWQCSLHGRCLRFCLRGGSGLLSGRHGFLFRHCCSGFIPIPGQVRRFPTEDTTGCQPSTTTKPNVLLGKDLHLQARPDYRHGWGAEDAGDVDQSSLGRRLLLGLSSRLLFSSSSGWFSASLNNWGLAHQLRHELLHDGGWDAATSSRLSHRIPVAFVPLLYVVGRRNLLQAMEFHRHHTTSRHKYSTTLLKEAYLLRCGLRDLKLLGHALAGHVAWPPWRRRQTSLQASWRILNERDMRQSRAAEP